MKSFALLPLLALCGCMALSVPRTEIEGSLGGQFSFGWCGGGLSSAEIVKLYDIIAAFNTALSR